MSDLTERLRRGFGGMVPPVCDEAANEIESLQSRLSACLEGQEALKAQTVRIRAALTSEPREGVDTEQIANEVSRRLEGALRMVQNTLGAVDQTKHAKFYADAMDWLNKELGLEPWAEEFRAATKAARES